MEIHFLRPYWLAMIIPFLLLSWYLSKLSKVDNWRHVCDEHLLSYLLVLPKHKIKLPLVLLTLAGFITVMALAGPSWEKQTQPIYRSSLARILVLNLSESMRESIGTVSKIDRARFKMIDILNGEKEGLTGLVVYTNEAFTISPLTEDNHTIANFVPALDPNIMPSAEDDTVVGLQQAEKLLQQAGFHSGSIILITDNVSNLSATSKKVKDLYQQGYRLYILEISPHSEINPEMQKLAQEGGGSVIALTPNNKDVYELIMKTKLTHFAATKKTNGKGTFWQDDGRWLVFLLLPLALLAFRKGYYKQ